MRVFSGGLLAIILFSSFGAIASEKAGFRALTHHVQNIKDTTGHRTGTAIVAIKNGEIVYEAYLGYADIEKKNRVDRDTVFYIASATKPFVALNVLLREDRGEIDTATSLKSMFPGVAFDGLDADRVTIRDLLTHTSGIDNLPLAWATAYSGIHDARTRERLVAQCYRAEGVARGTFEYTNVGYNILSVWLDREFEMPWQRQLQANIFKPLGMTHTSAYIDDPKSKRWRLAKPYSMVSVNRDTPLYLRKFDNTMHAAGGMISTAPDLARFLIAQMADGRRGRKQRLSSAAIERSHARQVEIDGARYQDYDRDGYAWGWYTGEYKGKRMLHHFGGFAGFHAHMSFIPEENLGLVVLNNEDSLAPSLTSAIADHAYGLLLNEADIDAKATIRFDDLLKKAASIPAAVVKQQEKIRARTWTLSLPMQAYVGRYSNPLLGDMTVEMNEVGQPIVRWGRLRSVATAFDGQDHARVEFSPNSGEVISFDVKDERVEAVRFNTMTFSRVR